MSYTKHLTNSNTQRKIVVQGKKGVAVFPKYVKQPIPQEKLWEEYWE